MVYDTRVGIKLISYLPAIIGVFLIGVFVYLNSPREAKNRLFACMNLAATIWLSFLLAADITNNVNFALWSLRFALFFGALLFLFFFQFSFTFPFKTNLRIRTKILLGLPLLIVAVLSFTPAVIESVVIKASGAQPEHAGFLYTTSDLLGLAYMFAGTGIILSKYRRSNNDEKSQIRFVMYGLSVAIIINIFTGIILTVTQSDSQFIYLGGFSLFIFSVMVAYAMVKHKLFDVRLVVVRSLGYLLSLGTIVLVTAFVVFGLSSTLVDAGVNQNIRLWLYVLITIVFSVAYQPLKKFFDRITNEFFYRDAYDTQHLLDSFNRALVSTIDINKLLKAASITIEEHIKPDFCDFIILDNNSSGTRIISSNKPSLLIEQFKKIQPLIHNTRGKLVVTDLLEDNVADLKSSLHDANIGVFVRINSNLKSETIGYIALGYKKSGNMFNTQDVAVIEILANELAIAIQNALRFEEIEQFNITLQQKVDDATRRLRSTNEKLKALDETKDEFISMASHQLRTPLTSVKGYISMVMEGDAGKISASQRKLLDQAFVSSQRMVYLIADLLNVSRLRTGKFVIEAKPTNLADLVEGEIGQLKETATGRNLELTYEKPKEFTSLMLDETKIRQVVMNFVDNAIYYTPAGGHINVKVAETPEAIEFTVTDDGLGVPKSEQHHLFGKFYRAGNAKKARPDGTGLGLFMAKKVIIAQGGSIIFTSTEGKGSTFGFHFSKAKLAVPAHIKAEAK